jgi:hypothetical protein
MLRTILLALLLVTPALRAQEPVQLFNGKDLAGWVWIPGGDGQGSKIEDVWSVEDGILKCKGKPGGYIRTEKDYTNYVLKVEWRFSKPGNSGVLLRMQGPDKVWPKSMEAQLQHKNAGDIWNIDEFPAKVDPARTEGRHTKKMHESSEKPVGEWNQYEITLDGTNLELKVNGTVQNTATEVQEIPGKICLQSEGAAIEFRKVELIPLGGNQQKQESKPLPGSAGSSSSSSSERKRLPGLEGWFVTGNGNWTYHDAVIEGQQTKDVKSYTHVVSDKTYKDLKASLKFKAVQGNSGFYFRAMPDQEGKMHGIQCEIDETRDAGGLYESYGRNWLVNPDDAENAKYFKPQDWNEMTLEVKGDRIVTHVNGVKVADFTDDKQRKEGHCALQIHGGQDVRVMFKDITIEALD